MKKLNYLLLVALLSFSTLFLAGCNEDDETSSTSGLIGTWVSTDNTADFSFEVTFNSGGRGESRTTFDFGSGPQTEVSGFSWTATATTITTIDDVDPEFPEETVADRTEVIEYSISGTTLTLTSDPGTSSEFSFSFTRK